MIYVMPQEAARVEGIALLVKVLVDVAFFFRSRYFQTLDFMFTINKFILQIYS